MKYKVIAMMEGENQISITKKEATERTNDAYFAVLTKVYLKEAVETFIAKNKSELSVDDFMQHIVIAKRPSRTENASINYDERFYFNISLSNSDTASQQVIAFMEQKTNELVFDTIELYSNRNSPRNILIADLLSNDVDFQSAFKLLAQIEEKEPKVNILSEQSDTDDSEAQQEADETAAAWHEYFHGMKGKGNNAVATYPTSEDGPWFDREW
jgi:hypothetical protein